MNLIWTKQFLKKYRKWELRHPHLKIKSRERILLFEKDPFHPALKTHSLVNELDGFWAFSINYEYRIIFIFHENNQDVILLNIGTHDEVY